MSGITKISFWLSKGRVDDAIASVTNFQTIVAANAAASECNPTKVLGLALHVAKAKKVIVVKTIGAKHYRQEVAYFRLVYFRGTESAGEMFGLVFNNEYRDMFLQSSLVIGDSYIIVRPRLIGDWNGLTILQANQPLLPARGSFTNLAFFPKQIPERGFLSFKLEKISLSVNYVRVVRTCSGTLCGGRYVNCPCVTVSHMPRSTFSLSLNLINKDSDGVSTNILSAWGGTIEPYSATVLSDKLISRADLQTILSSGDQRLVDVLDHVEEQLERGTWTVTGWWKMTTTVSDDVATLMPKLYLVRLDDDAEITKWTL